MATIVKRLENLERALEPDDRRIFVCWCNRDDDEHNPGCELYGLSEAELKRHRVIVISVGMDLSDL